MPFVVGPGHDLPDRVHPGYGVPGGQCDARFSVAHGFDQATVVGRQNNAPGGCCFHGDQAEAFEFACRHWDIRDDYSQCAGVGPCHVFLVEMAHMMHAGVVEGPGLDLVPDCSRDIELNPSWQLVKDVIHKPFQAFARCETSGKEQPVGVGRNVLAREVRGQRDNTGAVEAQVFCRSFGGGRIRDDQRASEQPCTKTQIGAV